MRPIRLKILAEIDELTDNHCKPCATRKYFDDRKDLTGLHHACLACPISEKLRKCGEKLSKAI